MQEIKTPKGADILPQRKFISAYGDDINELVASLKVRFRLKEKIQYNLKNTNQNINMKYLKTTILLTSILILTSCNWAKDKAKETANKTGEIVAETASEFGDGMYKGVKKTFKNEIQLSGELKKAGLEFGETTINSTDTTTDNILTTYIIFNQDFDKTVTIKLFNKENKEYGRSTKEIKGKKGQAKYFDFTFDKRVNIGVRGKITFE